MRILAISDHESPYFWDYFDKQKLEGIDLFLSCGDLDPRYLSFLATFFQGPVLYVHGNHDGIYQTMPPDGCICIEDRIYQHQGLRILGLGGSMRYKEGPYQYSQAEMDFRIFRLRMQIMRQGGFDILLTHSPAYDITDAPDLPHRGFKGFVRLMDKYAPPYMIHGHVHLNYGHNIKRTVQYGDTTIVNAYERYIFDI